jgi:hypothetical protein
LDCVHDCRLHDCRPPTVHGLASYIFSPASTRTGIRFSWGGNGHVAKALYAHDPDGLEFEVSWLVPADRIDDDMLQARSRIEALDLDKEIARFGADTQGGVGVSRPAAV